MTENIPSIHSPKDRLIISLSLNPFKEFNMKFIQEKYSDILIEVVNVSSATNLYAAEFKEILFKDIELGCRKIIVDLSNCDFIDSTFLGALVVSLKKITVCKGHLVLVGLHADVNSMFKMTNLFQIFGSFRTKEDAVKSLSPSEIASDT